MIIEITLGSLLVASIAYAVKLKCASSRDNYLIKSYKDRGNTLERQLSQCDWSIRELELKLVAARGEVESYKTPDVNLGIKSISFMARKPNGDLHDTKFTLGLGPCGKTVEWLHWSRGEDDCVLTQYHTDGSLKTFTFKTKDVLGREVIEKEAMELRRGTRAWNDLYKYRVKIDTRDFVFGCPRRA